MEKKLREAIANSDPLADATSRHLVEAGGKRIRPLLTLLCAHLGDASLPAVVQAAVVVELTHLATLYHDDVMDSAPFRRGAPTAHEVWGNSVAVLDRRPDLCPRLHPGVRAGLPRPRHPGPHL